MCQVFPDRITNIFKFLLFLNFYSQNTVEQPQMFDAIFSTLMTF